MSTKLIALPMGKATGLPAYRQGADKAVDLLDEIREQARGENTVSPYWLANALDGLSPDARRGFLVVVACYLAAASAVADDIAVCRKVGELMAAMDADTDNNGGAA